MAGWKNKQAKENYSAMEKGATASGFETDPLMKLSKEGYNKLLTMLGMKEAEKRQKEEEDLAKPKYPAPYLDIDRSTKRDPFQGTQPGPKDIPSDNPDMYLDDETRDEQQKMMELRMGALRRLSGRQ